MDPDDYQRRVRQVSAIAGIIIVLSAMDCVLLYCASRLNGEHETDSGSESLSSTDDESTDTEQGSDKGKTATASVRKRSAVPTNAADKGRKKKRRRISESEEQELEAMASSTERSINSLKDIVSQILAEIQLENAPPSKAFETQRAPRSEAFGIAGQAIRTIEKDEGFSDGDLVDAVLVIECDPSVADRYLHIKNKKERTSYLLHHMEKLKRGDYEHVV